MFNWMDTILEIAIDGDNSVCGLFDDLAMVLNLKNESEVHACFEAIQANEDRLPRLMANVYHDLVLYYPEYASNTNDIKLLLEIIRKYESMTLRHEQIIDEYNKYSSRLLPIIGSYLAKASAKQYIDNAFKTTAIADYPAIASSWIQEMVLRYGDVRGEYIEDFWCRQKKNGNPLSILPLIRRPTEDYIATLYANSDRRSSLNNLHEHIEENIFNIPFPWSVKKPIPMSTNIGLSVANGDSEPDLKYAAYRYLLSEKCDNKYNLGQFLSMYILPFSDIIDDDVIRAQKIPFSVAFSSIYFCSSHKYGGLDHMRLVSWQSLSAFLDLNIEHMNFDMLEQEGRDLEWYQIKINREYGTNCFMRKSRHFPIWFMADHFLLNNLMAISRKKKSVTVFCCTAKNDY